MHDQEIYLILLQITDGDDYKLLTLLFDNEIAYLC